MRGDSNGVWQESVKLSRAYISCFNVDPQFAVGFSLPKARGSGVFAIKFLQASFNKEAGSGEFFIEFEEKVWSSNLLKQFEDNGAGDVYIATFKHNDGNDSAASALLRVWELGERTGIMYSRGVCPEGLMSKARAKQAESKLKTRDSELDEKTRAAIKASLESVEGKIDHVGGQLTSVEKGVCETIPYYQAENERLKAALVYKTLECDRQEKRVADNTRLKNQICEANQEIWSLEQEIKSLKETNRLLHALDSAKWVIMEERALKRARAGDV